MTASTQEFEALLASEGLKHVRRIVVLVDDLVARVCGAALARP